MADFTITAGDSAPFISARLEDAAGQAANLNSASVRFIMRPIRGTGPTIAAAAVIDIEDPADCPIDVPNVHYEWAGTDTDVAGGYYGDFEATYFNGKRETFPNDRHLMIAIYDDIEAT